MKAINKKILMIGIITFISGIITSFVLNVGFENGVLFHDDVIVNASFFEEMTGSFLIGLIAYIAYILYVAILVYSFYKMAKASNKAEILKAKAINSKKELGQCYLLVAGCLLFVVLFSEYAISLSTLISIFIYLLAYILIPISVLIFLIIFWL